MTYRAPGPLAKLPPRAPWWRILRAFLDGTLRAAAARDDRHRLDREHGEHFRECLRHYSRHRYLGSVCMCGLWRRRELPGVEPTFYPPPPPPKGIGPRPVSVPE